MLSSRINPSSGDDENDVDDEEGETSMPGDYESWSGRAPRIPPPRPIVPPTRRRPPPPPPPSPPSKPRTPGRSATPRIKFHQSRRRRPLTPEIVIDRHSHRHHGSSRGHQIMTIPIDCQPTLGLRGPPRQILEIERVPCRRRRRHRHHHHHHHHNRHRKHRSLCYRYDDRDYNPPSQSNVMFANSLPTSYYSTVQQPMIAPVNQSSSLMTHISTLTPEMIENLPRQTVHLPPIHLPGSQADVNTDLETVIFPAEIINPADGTLSIIRSNSATNNNITGNIQHSAVVPSSLPPATLGITSGPFMQQVENLFQRMNLSQAQSIGSYYDPQSFPIINVANTDPYPPANIQTVIQRPNQPYNSTITAPVNPAIGTPYQPANITPSQPANNAPYRPANITPYRRANITPYQSTNTNAAPYSSYSNTTPSYNPANITPYRQNSVAPLISSDIGPYRPANITPYSAAPARSAGDSSILPPYYRSSTAAPSDSFNSYPSQSQTPYQANVSMPKSILRNNSMNSPVNTTYTRLNPPNILS